MISIFVLATKHDVEQLTMFEFSKSSSHIHPYSKAKSLAMFKTNEKKIYFFSVVSYCNREKARLFLFANMAVQKLYKNIYMIII